jgi:hypothetical protein
MIAKMARFDIVLHTPFAYWFSYINDLRDPGSVTNNRELISENVSFMRPGSVVIDCRIRSVTRAARNLPPILYKVRQVSPYIWRGRKSINDGGGGACQLTNRPKMHTVALRFPML